MGWIDAISLAELTAKGKTVVRLEGRQILLLRNGPCLYACANRCPHEGYPLSEGTLSEGCVLTCNWHNWKFDLATGETLVGGDPLPRYPLRVEGDRIFLEIAPEDPQLRRSRILEGVVKALEDQDQQRLVRETARLMRFGADPVDAVRSATLWVADRLEFGMTHALAGAADWLRLYDRPEMGPDERLAALGEILGHIADDVRSGHRFPHAEGDAPWSETDFLAALEREDETSAVRMVRGALAAGGSADDLLPALVTAALAHYADFGHALIYAVKTAALAHRLGAETAEPLLLMLVRSLAFAQRDDLLPEFRDYRRRLETWGKPRTPGPPLCAEALGQLSAKSAMSVVSAWGAAHLPEAIFPVLVEAGGWILLHVDERVLRSTDGKIADNVGWLDFTHVLTFADAALTAVRLRPELWPAVLLQLACFIGRNAGYASADLDMVPFVVDDPDTFIATETTQLIDHGRGRFIVSVHLLKTWIAALALIRAFPALRGVVLPAMKRFLHAVMKERHVLRTARQMRAFVAEE